MLLPHSLNETEKKNKVSYFQKKMQGELCDRSVTQKSIGLGAGVQLTYTPEHPHI